jgi:hypothetical protein
MLSDMRLAKLAPMFLLGQLVAGCSSNPPPRWAEGGAPLVVAPARWERGDSDETIDVLANGQVVQDGDAIMFIDRAGRVVDEDNEPIAILLPDGHVAGPDNRLLGRIGVSNAAPPESAAAWLAIMPDGTVVYFDEEGEREAGGVWRGCDGPQRRTCTLITHLVAMQKYNHNRRSGVGVGVGIGIGF